mgnify:CR=1 FL=1
MAKYALKLKPDAVKDLDRMRKYDATKALDGIEEHLSFEPMKESRSRIKKLRGKPPTDYRLRIDDWRIFYQVVGKEVHILRVMHKKDTQQFYEEEES